MGGVTTDKVKEINKNSTIYTTRELQERRQRDHNFKRQIQQSFASHGKSLSRMGSKIHRNVREFFDKAEDQVMSDDGAAASYIKRADSQQRQSDNEFSDRLDVDLTDQTVLRHREVLELLLKLKNAERQGREMDAVGAVNGINLENGQLTGEAAANLKGVLDQMRSMRDSLAAEPEEKTKEGSGEEPKEKFGENKEEGLEKKDKEGHEEETQEEPGGEIQEEPGEKTGEESGGETQEEPGEKTKEKHEEKTKYKKEEKEKIVRMLDFYLGHFAYLDGMLDVPENTKDMLVVSLSDLTTDEMLDTDLSVVKLDATQTEVALSERFENFESQVDPDREIVTLPGKYKDAPLFPTMPSMRDVKQGHMEDGYFISSIASIIENDPKQIMKLMRDHGDNTVTVRFFREKPKKNVKQEQGQTQGQAEEQTQAQNIEDIEKEPEIQEFYVTVTKDLPEVATAYDAQGNVTKTMPIYAEGALWLRLLEKAYAASGLNSMEKEKEEKERKEKEERAKKEAEKKEEEKKEDEKKEEEKKEDEKKEEEKKEGEEKEEEEKEGEPKENKEESKEEKKEGEPKENKEESKEEKEKREKEEKERKEREEKEKKRRHGYEGMKEGYSRHTLLHLTGRKSSMTTKSMAGSNNMTLLEAVKAHYEKGKEGADWKKEILNEFQSFSVKDGDRKIQAFTIEDMNELERVIRIEDARQRKRVVTRRDKNGRAVEYSYYREQPAGLDDLIRVIMSSRIREIGWTTDERKRLLSQHITKKLAGSDESGLQYARFTGQYTKSAEETFNKISDALGQKKPVTASSKAFFPKEGKGLNGETRRGGIAEGHTYSVLGTGTRGENKFIVLRNPWAAGRNVYHRMGDGTVMDKMEGAKTSNGVFLVELNDFMRRFDGVYGI